MKCLTNLDMVKNQIINGVIQKVTADPTTKLVEGWLIYNTTDKKFKVYDGESWVALGSSGSVSGGDGQSINIVKQISSSSTDDEVASAKAVYDFTTKEMEDIRTVSNGNILSVGTDGKVKGISIDTEVTEDSTNIISSGAVKSYVDSKMSTVDAMVFMGTVDTNGTITSTDETINGSKFTELTEFKNGWTFKAKEDISKDILNTDTPLEAGDIIIVVKDVTTYTSDIISVVQNNIDGVVTGPNSATDDTIVLFDGNTGKLVKSSTITASQLLGLFEHAINLETGENSPDIVLQSSNTENSSIVKPGQTVKATLKNSGVTAGNYGNNEGVLDNELDDKDSFIVPEITVDSKGRIIDAKNVTIKLNLESKATRHDFNNPKLSADAEGNCTWIIELAHTEMPVITLYEVTTKEVILADIRDNAANDEIIITFRNQSEISAGTYHATIIA